MTCNYLTEANWLHVQTEAVYCIVQFATNSADMSTMVIYRKADDSGAPIWVRSATEFFDGRFVRVFPGMRAPKK